ncbi:hypothetical protein [Fontivita pretiosa]|uniref:hypothetical protein n=1 Tax=Fontivita pretiosa TaxID=2989684 RepID=UPI003D172AB1
MELVKKNLVSIICGVVILIAIAAVFYPINGYYAELQAKADSRKQVYQTLKNLAQKQRSLPIISLETQQAEPLPMFPTEAVAKVGREAVDKVKAEAIEMLKLALELNQHQLLEPGALPQGTPYSLIQFRDKYIRKFNFYDPQNRKNSFLWEIMRAGAPPTDQEIQAERERKRLEIEAKRALNTQGQPINEPQVQAELQATLPKIASNMQKKVAEECLVYIEPSSNPAVGGIPSAVDPMPALVNPGQFNAPPDPSAVFEAQVGLWIHEDVARAIAAANRGARNVTESVVKRLVRIELPDVLFPQQQMASPEGMPVATNSDPAGQIPQNFTVSPTGRISNGVYDVIHFTVRMDVDAERIPLVLQELSRNRFITVLSTSLSSTLTLNNSPVDPAVMELAGYLYGEKPVVQLDVQCEALLLRKWTEPLMPVMIKRNLGLAPQPGAQPGM